MLLELRGPRRRIDGHGHSAGIEHAEERREKLKARGQHDRDPLAGLKPRADQAAGGDARPFRKLAIGQLGLGADILPQRDMNPLAVFSDMPVEHLGECLELGRRRLDRLLLHRLGARKIEGRKCRRIGERRDHVLEGLRLAQQSVGHPHREGALDPEQELRPREAVEAPVAFERAGQSANARAVRVDLARKLARDRDEREAYLFEGLWVGRLLHRPALGSSSPFIDPAVSPFEPCEGLFSRRV